MLGARFSHLHFCQSLPTPQCGLSAIADLLVKYVLANVCWAYCDRLVWGSACCTSTLL